LKTILIFGATGTLGAYTSIYLKNLGYDVIAVGRRQNDNGFFKDYEINYFSIDVTQKKYFSKLKNIKINCVLHFSGDMPANMSGYYPQKYIDSIITGTHNVLEFCVENSIHKIVFTQSRADSTHLMGSLNPVPSDIYKTFPLNTDHSIYAICKNAAVDLIEHYFHKYGIKRFVLRLPTIYAYHPNPFFYVDGEKRLIAYRLIIEKAIRGEKIEIWGDPSKSKEITYIMDFCQVVEKSIVSDLSGGIYNIGRGVGVTLEEQIKGIIKIFSSQDRISEIVYRPDKPDARQFIHDITKTQIELGYNPDFDYLLLLKEFKIEMQKERFAKLWGRRSDYTNKY